MKVNYLELSRTVSHALRHDPESYGLSLDSEGWVAADDLLAALAARSAHWQGLTQGDLYEMICRSEKVRHETDGARIRALYGHSTEERLTRQPSEPPQSLFHGTDAAAAELIGQEGLKPMARQYVHLSLDKATARMVGLRKSQRPVILRIAAGLAHRAGVSFYQGNDSIWLADSVPPRFIAELIQSNDDRFEE